MKTEQIDQMRRLDGTAFKKLVEELDMPPALVQWVPATGDYVAVIATSVLKNAAGDVWHFPDWAIAGRHLLGLGLGAFTVNVRS